MQSQIAKEMLNNIPDPRMRKLYGDILAGRKNLAVYCMNPAKVYGKRALVHPKEYLIGYVEPSGHVLDSPSVDEDRNFVAGIETSRDRLDGRKGFKCYCGNTSIRSEEEQQVLGSYAEVPIISTPPTREQLTSVFELVQKNKKGQLQFVDGAANYDGFMLKEVVS